MSNIATLYSPEYLAFIRKMVEDPDDDAVRLVCADWLEEHGLEDRAKYIRYSLHQDIHKEWSEVLKTYDESENEYPDVTGMWPRNSWPDSISCIAAIDHPGNGFLWRRGFVKSVDCNLQQWMKWGIDLCRLHPVEELVLRETKAMPLVREVVSMTFQTFYVVQPAAVYQTNAMNLGKLSFSTHKKALSAIGREVLHATRRAIGIETPVAAS